MAISTLLDVDDYVVCGRGFTITHHELKPHIHPKSKRLPELANIFYSTPPRIDHENIDHSNNMKKSIMVRCDRTCWDIRGTIILFPESTTIPIYLRIERHFGNCMRINSLSLIQRNFIGSQYDRRRRYWLGASWYVSCILQCRLQSYLPVQQKVGGVNCGWITPIFTIVWLKCPFTKCRLRFLHHTLINLHQSICWMYKLDNC